MRHLKLRAAHSDTALLRQLLKTFIAGQLQLPAWEIFLLLYPRPARLAPLPSLREIAAIVEIEGAAGAAANEVNEPQGGADFIVEPASASQQGSVADPAPHSVAATRRYVPHNFRSRCTRRTPLSDDAVQALAHLATPVLHSRYFRSSTPVCIARVGRQMIACAADYARIAQEIQRALVVASRQCALPGLEHLLVTGANLVLASPEMAPPASAAPSDHAHASSPAAHVFLAVLPDVPAWIEGRAVVPGDATHSRVLREARELLVAGAGLRLKLPPVGAQDEAWRAERIVFLPHKS
jgi:hypothetical protein